jgi:acetoin utilization protein AcuB
VCEQEEPVPTASKTTLTVRRAMTPNPVTATPDMSVGELIALLDRHVLPGCPVVDGAGLVLGVVSRLDLLRGLRPSRELDLTERHAFYSQPVRDLMRYGVVKVEVEDPLVAAVDLILDTRVHSLPVVQQEDGRTVLVGIVTQGDLLRAILGEERTGRP